MAAKTCWTEGFDPQRFLCIWLWFICIPNVRFWMTPLCFSILKLTFNSICVTLILWKCCFIWTENVSKFQIHWMSEWGHWMHLKYILEEGNPLKKSHLNQSVSGYIYKWSYLCSDTHIHTVPKTPLHQYKTHRLHIPPWCLLMLSSLSSIRWLLLTHRKTPSPYILF